METAELRRAYDVLLAEVEAGGFGPPPADELTAEQVLAHLAVNDELLTETTEAVLAGSPWAYYDIEAIHRPQLDELVARYGGLAGLAAVLRDSSAKLCTLTESLGDKAETPVWTHIREGFDLRVDEPLPWGRTLDIHGRVHLPAHTEQLRALRKH
ncbi:hypothetical protein GCM10027280_61460 [Micromonospora polyrhachis]|uniref:DinB family protein n=1 Tax=Micromonospora polyrhachis TaxID=1282883 RepID=A0A7W7WNQ2_9ACTN|nr:hypothetical protein [Micromonospora polyrhachis]MBB4957872.1 hypothetical protein [Micromonospora polyrhachis]